MRRPPLTAAIWWALCLLHAVPGLVALVTPARFASGVAGLATDAPHYVRDVGVAELALAGLAAVAAVRPAVRPAAAGVLALQLALHAVSHTVDGLGGPVVASLVAQAVLLAIAAARSAGPTPARGASAPAPP